MSRARLIVKEIEIIKQGEVNFFQVRLPKNAVRIIGVDTDVLMISALESPTETPVSGGSGGAGGVRPDGTIGHDEVSKTPFLKWNTKTNPTVGKLKLQNMDRSNIFFEAWVSFIFLNGSMPDLSYGLFPKSPYSTNVNTKPKQVIVSCTNTLINGMFSDAIGVRLNKHMNYKVKVFVWIETSEKSQGVVYDFEQKKELEVKL